MRGTSHSTASVVWENTVSRLTTLSWRISSVVASMRSKASVTVRASARPWAVGSTPLGWRMNSRAPRQPR